MRGRWLVAAGAWVVVAAATTATAVAAVNSLGAGLLGPADAPLSQRDVQRDLSTSGKASPPVDPPPTGTASPEPTSPATSAQPVDPRTSTTSDGPAPPGSATKALATAGGTIVARCSGTAVTLVAWTPAPGFRTDEVQRGPATIASVKFKHDSSGHGDSGSELTVLVSCPGGQPRADVHTDE